MCDRWFPFNYNVCSWSDGFLKPIFTNPLSRFRVNFNGFSYIKSFNTTVDRPCVQHSIAQAGTYSAAFINDAVFVEANIRASRVKELSISQIERLFREDKQSNDAVLAACLFVASYGLLPTVTLSTGGIQRAVCHYQTLYPLITEDGSPSMTSFTEPFLGGATIPAKGYNNDTACFLGRVNNARNDDKPVPLLMWHLMREFVDLCLPKWTAAPLDTSEAVSQMRPNQRSKWERIS
jgi:hypothetical protein